jgi:hypothetical protein
MEKREIQLFFYSLIAGHKLEVHISLRCFSISFKVHLCSSNKCLRSPFCNIVMIALNAVDVIVSMDINCTAT